VTDDEVIEHAHIDERKRALQCLREVLVGTRGLGRAGRVFVGQHDGAGVQLERALDDLKRVVAWGTI
jgi:hypothetical protein